MDCMLTITGAAHTHSKLMYNGKSVYTDLYTHVDIFGPINNKPKKNA